MHSSAADNCKRVLINFYNVDELIDAKKSLWNACSDHLGNYHDRNDSITRPAKVAYAFDIIEAIKLLDSLNKLPDILAKDIGRLPDRQPEELNLLLIAQKVAELEKAKDLHNEVLTT